MADTQTSNTVKYSRSTRNELRYKERRIKNYLTAVETNNSESARYMEIIRKLHEDIDKIKQAEEERIKREEQEKKRMAEARAKNKPDVKDILIGKPSISKYSNPKGILTGVIVGDLPDNVRVYYIKYNLKVLNASAKRPTSNRRYGNPSGNLFPWNPNWREEALITIEAWPKFLITRNNGTMYTVRGKTVSSDEYQIKDGLVIFNREIN